MKIDTLTVGMFEENCYLVSCPETQEALVIDPGAEGARIIDTIERLGITPIRIVNTHGHGDHIAANADIKGRYNIPLVINGADADCLVNPWANSSALFNMPITSPPADDYINAGETVDFGTCSFTVLATPGHTPGGISLYSSAAKVVIVGDALFAGSIGRTDLPGGDTPMLLESIRANLLTLPDETVVYPGHGPTTTIGEEKQHNPFVGAAARR